MAINLRDNRMFWLWAISPTTVGLVLVLILAEFQLIEFHFSIHDIDTFILFSGLMATALISFVLLSREGIRLIELNTEKKLRAAFAEDRTRFLRRLDHEIKNPLMGIQTALDNLSGEQDPAKRQIIRTAITEQITRLTRLVAELRRIGDMEHHKIERLVIDPNMLLHDAFLMLSDQDQTKQRRINMDIPDNLPQIVGDYDLLLLALHNILINAVKYTHDGDSIRIDAQPDDDCLHITISDTGPGISPEDLPYIMDELYRSERVKGIAGSGIGLALVKRIIERHDGKIMIDSHLNKGTSVKLCLPIEFTKT